MDLVDTIFTKIGLPKEDWLLDVDNYEQQELVTKNKLMSSYKIKEKNFNINYTARIYNVNMTKYSKFEETDLPLMLQIGSQLKHLSILQIKGFSPINFKHKKNPVLFTEFVSNGNLSDLFEKQRKIPNLNLMSDTKKLINIYGIASGMKYIHSQDIIHCQLQTSSIFLDSNLYPKIFEFGQSQKVSKPQKQAKYNTTAEPSFIAPEIWERKGFTKSSDVYAFGMIV